MGPFVPTFFLSVPSAMRRCNSAMLKPYQAFAVLSEIHDFSATPLGHRLAIQRVASVRVIVQKRPFLVARSVPLAMACSTRPTGCFDSLDRLVTVTPSLHWRVR